MAPRSAATGRAADRAAVRVPARLLMACRVAACLVAACLVAACLLAGCSQGLVSTAEAHREVAFNRMWERNLSAMAVLEPPLSSCNIGGDVRICQMASAQMITVLQAFAADVAATPVPARFTTTVADLNAALSTLIAGYQQRNVGLATTSNDDFVAGNAAIDRGLALLQKANSDFPPDARPSPPVLPSPTAGRI